MVTRDEESRLIRLRRDLHKHPEPCWGEFYTTARIVDELEAIGVDELHVGPEIHTNERLRPPTQDELERARKRALESGIDANRIETFADGYTGAIAVFEGGDGDGPTIGLRVDIDALPQTEADDADHRPAAEGFRSQHEGLMHACGHDAHAATGVGVLEAIAESDFRGTLKVIFQPGEEKGAGAASIVESGHLKDIDALFAVHVGLDQELGTVIPGIDSFLAVNGFTAEFTGAPAHAGNNPHEGSNALQAMATAIENLYGIPRHANGASRVNAGRAEGGTVMNTIPESASITGEVRGETTEIREYMETRVEDVLTGAAMVHGCDVDVEFMNGAPSAECDAELVEIVTDVATERGQTILEDGDGALGGSEDATRLMRAVQYEGGTATYVGIGGGNQYGHHTARFDIDEEAIFVAVDVLTDSILSAEESLS
ncbi:amidohydrolase [Natrialbaceae archaeon A-gly3]